jgi:hypothetical protein
VIDEQEYVAEVIESVLAELGVEATRREAAWVVAGAAGVELVVSRTAEDAAVRATLADLDGATAECRAAVAEFLRRAAAGLRVVTVMVDEQAASIEARASAAYLDVELASAIEAAGRAAALLVQETRALVRPEVARAYLRHGDS